MGSERKDPNSILNFYRHLILLRKEDPALRDGKCAQRFRPEHHVLPAPVQRRYRARSPQYFKIQAASNLRSSRPRPRIRYRKRHASHRHLRQSGRDKNRDTRTLWCLHRRAHQISIAILRSGATQHMRIQAYLRLRDRSFSSDITHKLIIGF